MNTRWGLDISLYFSSTFVFPFSNTIIDFAFSPCPKSLSSFSSMTSLVLYWSKRKLTRKEPICFPITKSADTYTPCTHILPSSSFCIFLLLSMPNLSVFIISSPLKDLPFGIFPSFFCKVNFSARTITTDMQICLNILRLKKKNSIDTVSSSRHCLIFQLTFSKIFQRESFFFHFLLMYPMWVRFLLSNPISELCFFSAQKHGFYFAKSGSLLSVFISLNLLVASGTGDHLSSSRSTFFSWPLYQQPLGFLCLNGSVFLMQPPDFGVPRVQAWVLFSLPALSLQGSHSVLCH